MPTAGRASLRRDQSGSISVELALVATFVLLPLVAGVWDFGRVVQTQAQLDQALAAAFEFAWSSPSNAVNIDRIVAAAVAAYGASPALTTTHAAISYGCIQAGNTSGASKASYSVTAPDSSSGTCDSGTLAPFVTVSLGTSVALPVPLPVWGRDIALSVAGTVRAQ